MPIIQGGRPFYPRRMTEATEKRCFKIVGQERSPPPIQSNNVEPTPRLYLRLSTVPIRGSYSGIERRGEGDCGCRNRQVSAYSQSTPS